MSCAIASRALVACAVVTRAARPCCPQPSSEESHVPDPPVAPVPVAGRPWLRTGCRLLLDLARPWQGPRARPRTWARHVRGEPARGGRGGPQPPPHAPSARAGAAVPPRGTRGVSRWPQPGLVSDRVHLRPGLHGRPFARGGLDVRHGRPYRVPCRPGVGAVLPSVRHGHGPAHRPLVLAEAQAGTFLADLPALCHRGGEPGAADRLGDGDALPRAVLDLRRPA